jgi:hypothetical protein
MRSIARDLQYALRGVSREPGFTLLAVLTLALGIGAATTMFSVIHNVLFDPFPYRDAHRVVTVQIHDDSNARPGGRNFFQTPEFLELIVIGIVLGFLASAAATRVIASQLRDISPYDPFTFASVGVVMLLAGMAACYVPARRATRVDPLVALRYE